MLTSEIILDHTCLSQGLPPLSMGPKAAYEMIRKLPPDQKRKVMRKLRKLARREISRRCHEESCLERRQQKRQYLEKKCNLSKHDKKSHGSLFVETRLHLVKNLFLRSIQNKND